MKNSSSFITVTYYGVEEIVLKSRLESEQYKYIVSSVSWPFYIHICT